MYSTLEFFFKDLWVWLLVVWLIRAIMKKKAIPTSGLLLFGSYRAFIAKGPSSKV